MNNRKKHTKTRNKANETNPTTIGDYSKAFKMTLNAADTHDML